jgi:phosphoribosylformylglycinamidine synthase subunit PurL
MTVLAAEPRITPEVVRRHMTDEEYEQLRKILGRDPSWTELGITSALWSEH